jgi:hypothetical protein
VNFKARIETPPALTAGRYADVPAARSDDWSGLAPLAAPILDLTLHTGAARSTTAAFSNSRNYPKPSSHPSPNTPQTTWPAR